MQHGLSPDLHDAKYQLAKRPARSSLEHIKNYHLASPMTTKNKLDFVIPHPYSEVNAKMFDRYF